MLYTQTLASLAILAFGIVGTPQSQAQKGGVQPDLRVPCAQIRESEFEACTSDRTSCLNAGTPSGTCTAQFEQCEAEANAAFQECVANGGQASAGPFLSFTPAPVAAAWNVSRQSRALLNTLAN
jgi:predicted carbohydrate-binding protein with CBM5 and CBM33 domain